MGKNMFILVRHRSTAEGEKGNLYEHIGEIFYEGKRW